MTDWLTSAKCWLSLGPFYISLFIIGFRLSIREKDNGFNYDTFSFVLWLQLQIMAFYILLLTLYPVLLIVYNLLYNTYLWLVELFAKRVTHKIMKMLKLITLDWILWKLACIGVIFILLTITTLIGYTYYKMVYYATVILLGYTKF
jgi:hypothetical protein